MNKIAENIQRAIADGLTNGKLNSIITSLEGIRADVDVLLRELDHLKVPRDQRQWPQDFQ